MEIGILIGARIKAFREARGMTQLRLAQILGKSVETISNFERGKVVTSILTLSAVARALEVPLGHFFDGIDAKVGYTDDISESARFVMNGLKVLPEEDVELLAGIVGVMERRRSSSV